MQYLNKREQTKAKIMNAFIELYSEKDIAQVTVRMICEKAGINRSTFYTYYTDVYALKEDKEREIIDDLSEKIMDPIVRSDDIDVEQIVRILIDYIKEHNGVPLLFIKKSDSALIDLFFNIFTSKLQAKGIRLPEEKKQLIIMCITYHFNGLIALLEDLEASEAALNIDEFLGKVARLANEGPITVVRKTLGEI